jgi:hypothetical protein
MKHAATQTELPTAGAMSGGRDRVTWADGWTVAKLESWAAIPLRLIVGYGFMEHGYAKIIWVQLDQNSIGDSGPGAVWPAWL